MTAQWIIADSESYRAMLRNGWHDTGFRREWCGGTLVCAMMVIDERKKAKTDGAAAGCRPEQAQAEDDRAEGKRRDTAVPEAFEC